MKTVTIPAQFVEAFTRQAPKVAASLSTRADALQKDGLLETAASLRAYHGQIVDSKGAVSFVEAIGIVDPVECTPAEFILLRMTALKVKAIYEAAIPLMRSIGLDTNAKTFKELVTSLELTVISETAEQIGLDLAA